MKNRLKEKISLKAYMLIKRYYLRLKSIPYVFNLSKLAKIYKTDKWGTHFYTKHYQHYFKRLKFKRIKLLEIGVGGYKNIDEGGNSLRMWKRYFPFGKIFSIDIYDKSNLQERRLKIWQGSQVDEPFLNSIFETIVEADIIIDDGSHINEHVIKTFEILFPKLKDNGIYVIEDTETSYWPDYGGDSANLNNPSTLCNYFKSLTDCLNHQELVIKDYQPTYLDMNITSIHFYHNLIFIFKGKNNESSNVDFDNLESITAETYS